MVKVRYNDKLVYKVIIWVFWGLFYEKRRKSFNIYLFKEGYKVYINIWIMVHTCNVALSDSYEIAGAI